jgi:hypothetical protein
VARERSSDDSGGHQEESQVTQDEQKAKPDDSLTGWDVFQVLWSLIQLMTLAHH